MRARPKEGWEASRLGWLFRPVSVRDHPDETVLSVFRDHGVVPKDSRPDNFNRTPENLASYQLVQPGDLVVNRMKAWQGSLGLTPHRGIVSPDYEVLRLTTGDVEPCFLHQLLRSRPLIDQYGMRSTGIRPSQWRLYWDQMKTIEVRLPPLAEQRAIANYLDRQIAQIDTLIAKQKQLIATVRERRQAVIDHAFSGAIATSQMQLRRAIRFLTSGSRGWGTYYAEEGERFVRIGNLPRTSLPLRGEVQYVDLPAGVTEGERTRLQDQDLLFSITAYLGSVAVVEDEWVNAYVSQHVALCRLDRSQLNPRCTGYFMLTTFGQDQLKEGAYGGTKLQLSLNDIRGLVVPGLPLEEQDRIAKMLDEQTAKIDTLIAKTEQFIKIATERRAALISSAVTGQIDVLASARARPANPT